MLALTITLYAIGIVILGCGSAILLSMQLARRSAAPYFPSAKSTIRLALREADLKPGEWFYDLGAGTGNSIIIAEKEFGAHAVGSEINMLPYCIAKLKIFFARSHVQMKFESLFTQDVSNADIVFIFLAERVLARVAEKLKKELKPGARIISYAFTLPGMTPEKVVPVHGAWKLYIYVVQ
jgi:precorrin-6B methylase 2